MSTYLSKLSYGMEICHSGALPFRSHGIKSIRNRTAQFHSIGNLAFISKSYHWMASHFYLCLITNLTKILVKVKKFCNVAYRRSPVLLFRNRCWSFCEQFLLCTWTLWCSGRLSTVKLHLNFFSLKCCKAQNWWAYRGMCSLSFELHVSIDIRPLHAELSNRFLFPIVHLPTEKEKFICLSQTYVTWLHQILSFSRGLRCSSTCLPNLPRMWILLILLNLLLLGWWRKIAVLCDHHFWVGRFRWYVYEG